jgi:hypothetical protein
VSITAHDAVNAILWVAGAYLMYRLIWNLCVFFTERTHPWRRD